MDSVKDDVKGTVDKAVSKTCLGQEEKDQWWALVDTSMNLLDP
jgi:hypothetical protein